MPALHKAGSVAPLSGYYWCSVCKAPAHFEAGDRLPHCPNKCAKGDWEYVRASDGKAPKKK